MNALTAFPSLDTDFTTGDSSPLLRVLHVVEALGGGVEIAIKAMVEATPGVEHHLHFNRRSSVSRWDVESAFASTTEMGCGRRTQYRSTLHRIDELQPDVVHAHSSWAGLYTRLRATGVPVVYSPHCFASERLDIGRIPRFIYRAVERLLAPRTDVLLANGDFEASLAAGLPRPAGRVEAVNFLDPRFGDRMARPEVATRRPLRVVTVGRWCPQKDPAFFSNVVSAVGARSAGEFEFRWIGGPDLGCRVATNQDFEITGWLDSERVAHELAAADIVVHTASWEAGAPLSVIEACAMGKPVLTRSIPAMRALGLPSFVTPDEMAVELLRLVAEPDELSRWSTHSRFIWRRLEARFVDFDFDGLYRKSAKSRTDHGAPQLVRAA